MFSFQVVVMALLKGRVQKKKGKLWPFTKNDHKSRRYFCLSRKNTKRGGSKRPDFSSFFLACAPQARSRMTYKLVNCSFLATSTISTFYFAHPDTANYISASCKDMTHISYERKLWPYWQWTATFDWQFKCAKLKFKSKCCVFQIEAWTNLKCSNHIWLWSKGRCTCAEPECHRFVPYSAFKASIHPSVQ